MYRPRVIPCLLLKNRGLVKSFKFKDFKYVGDPINAVKIFNDKRADELMFLDITATKEKRQPDFELIRHISDEANMPFAFGGGIRSLDAIQNALKSGAEKIVLSTYAIEKQDFIKQAVAEFGSSTIVVCVDVKKNFWGNQLVYSHCGTSKTNLNPIEFAVKMAEFGAGEIVVNNIDLDGMMAGYDLTLISAIASKVSVPVVALGGAKNKEDLKKAVFEGKASAAAAGSLFVFQGPHKAVLISFPSQSDLTEMFQDF